MCWNNSCKLIMEKNKIFIIAEIGINHNWDINLAKKLIDVAAESGADAVKFQKRDINLVYAENFLKQKRESPWGDTQRHQKEGLEFGENEYDEIDQYCKNKNINWFVSCWDVNSIEFIKKYKLKFQKIASAMIVDISLLEKIAETKTYTFISTGMCNYNDIDAAINIFKEENCDFELMHTNSTYPSLVEDINLNCINTLKNKFNCKVGYSGHETGIAISIASVALGISSLERHITLDKTMYGSDQSASLEPNGFRDLVSAVRKVEKAIGDGVKKFTDKELEVALKLRGHINWSKKSSD